MWIARDKDNSLWLYNEKPVRNEEGNYWTISSVTDNTVDALHSTMFPELKWEDEAMEVDLLPKCRTNKTDITVTRENIIFNDSYWTALRNQAAMALMTVILDKQDDFLSKPMLEDVADLSVDCANILVKKLKRKDIKI